MISLRSTLTGDTYPFARLEEFADNGESLEVALPHIPNARVGKGTALCERFAEFLPFTSMDTAVSMGEGNTPLLGAGTRLCDYTGLRRLFFKNETQNPTWSFKDRGSLACIFMAQQMKEGVTATISTGNMGHSIAAYGARAGLQVIVFVPEFIPREKILAMAFHGATVMRVQAPDYSAMKLEILRLARELGLRIVTGNGPIRVEGYKLTAFEMYEQMGGRVPDYIAVPTSACGHVRGLFKGYRELMEAGLTTSLPRMIIVQARNNSPIAAAIKQGKSHVIPVANVQTIAEAITTGNPMGGDELIDKAKRFGWLAEDVTEEEILESQRRLGADGLFVEPAAATSLAAVRKLRAAGSIATDATVVLMLTGSGLKDLEVLRHHPGRTVDTTINRLRGDLGRILQ
jgi:threonine synthase